MQVGNVNCYQHILGGAIGRMEGQGYFWRDQMRSSYVGGAWACAWMGSWFWRGGEGELGPSKYYFQLITERDPMTSSRKYRSLRSPFFSSPSTLPQAVLPPYRSELPDYLIGIIDQITKADEFQVLRYDFLHYPLEEVVLGQGEPREVIWLWVDPIGDQHLLSRAPHPLLPPRNALSIERSGALLSGEHKLDQLSAICCNLLANKLQSSVIENISRTKFISIDQIRLNCQANLYTHPMQLDQDLRRLISWNQVFRASSTKTFEYLSILYEKIINIILRKDLFNRFLDIKKNDIARLYRYQTQYRTVTTKWPYIPASFREYQEIDRYVPTPPQRAPIINHRLLSKKEPIDCPDTCVCLIDSLPEGQQFCRFTLLNGWQSDCPNRARKLECSHADPLRAARCRNCEIQRHQRKVCAGKAEDDGQRKAQIQQRLTWGIDLYTRNIIYHCLPEIDIEADVKRTPNDVRRNHFIEHTLARAMNFMGAEGYNLLETCNYIKAHSEPPHPHFHLKEPTESTRTKEELPKEEAEKGAKIEEGNEVREEVQEMREEGKTNEPVQIKEGPGKQSPKLFSSRDHLYADLLARNYQFAEDKTGFRVHTKGKGAICIDQGGIAEGSFIVQYFGEIYQPWRWYDRQDFIKQVLKKKKLKNYIPEFYNIYLEKHQDEPLGYDMLVVDPSKMGNYSSRFSHSCEPNCGTVITVSEGRYFIGMYAFRPISFGEELTFDYCSMTESNYEHLNSICLCGMRRCRGNYLQLSNNKIFNNLMDNRNCFFTRNSSVLKSTGSITPNDLEICARHNIKEGFLDGTPRWIVRWMARVLSFMEEEGEIYKGTLLAQWRTNYPWDTSESEEEKEKKRQLYSETSKQDLLLLRFQNLITSVDKLKFFFSRNELNQQPPIFIEDPPRVVEVLITRHDSVLLELQECLIKYKCEELAKTVQIMLKRIQATECLLQKLFLFRLTCLLVSHRLLFLDKPPFSHQLLSDIVYFYAFTHTYFSPSQYKSFEADEITVGLNEILGDKNSSERKEKSKKKYSGPFVWGQVVSWYKQTIVCPEASLSQDRRGTLSYPLIKSIMRSEYPYEKQSRAYFLKTLQERPANSWPPAHGCDLSFKNPYKLYGTMLFESVHSRDKLAGRLPKDSLLESAIATANSSLRVKLDLFKIVESILSGTPPDNPKYNLIAEMSMDLDANVPLQTRNNNLTAVGEPRKRMKRDSQDSS